MKSIADFEDMLDVLARHDVRYLIIGGLAFIFHAKPRYTKDMDLWIDLDDANIERTNRALAEFGSPVLIEPRQRDQIVQIGVAPDRIDLILCVEGVDFAQAWRSRVEAPYGRSLAHWIDLDGLLAIKSAINHPRHQDDAAVLRRVKELLTQKKEL